MPDGKKYTSPGIDVYFQPRLCIHAAKCVGGAPHVFDPEKRPWIDPASEADPAALAEVIDRCPTGALHYVRADGVEEVPDGHTSVKIVKGGPMYVRGDVALAGIDGHVFHRDTRVALCRWAPRRTSRSATTATKRPASPTDAR